MTFTCGSLFSGIGGLDLAAHWAGFTTSWFVEREIFCQKVLSKHWPNTPIYDDVFKVAGIGYGKEGQTEIAHVDILHGGFP